MSLLQVKNLTFCYEGSYDNIFENVSFQLDTDWHLGLTGRNGRGKTTLLKILQGTLDYRGTVTGNVRFEYFPYEVKNKELLTSAVVESILPDVLQWELIWEFHQLNLTEEVLERSFCTLSNGEQTKVLLAALFLKENSFLLIDEPTNHLDIEARELVSRYLLTKHGFILISHDRSFLDRCVDHILAINKTDITVTSGNFSSWWYNKELADSQNAAHNEKLKKEIGQLNEAAKRASGWSLKAEKAKRGGVENNVSPDRGYIGHKAAKVMKRSKTIEGRMFSKIQEKSGLLKNIETAGDLKLSPLSYHSDRLAELENISIAYGNNTVCRDISFRICEGDRIALCGKNGSGKSSILKLIMGQNIPYTGKLTKGSGLNISYVAQDTSHLQGCLTEYAATYQIDESLFKSILRKLDFSRIQLEKDMCDFSGGQKKKVLIARSLCEKAHLYVWDEPLNFIDIISRMQIEALLLTFRPTLIFVEHDSAFVDNIATQKIVLE